jgi:probable O-glycosylation ligase (exosortase A-associated)
MKHFFFMFIVTVMGSAAAIAAPFWGVMMYYSYATLRPQYLWDWSLSNAPQLRWSLIAGLISVVATLLNLSTILRTFRSNKVLILLMIYAVLMMCSMLTAYNPKIAMYWAEEYGKVFLMALVATLVIQRFWQVRAMGVMIALCLGYIAYEVNFIYFTQGGRLDIYHHGYGGLDNNGAGALIVLGLPFIYFLATSPVGNWSKGRRIFGAILGLALLHAVMMTYSRGAMLTAVAGLLWLLIHHRPRLQTIVVAPLLVCAIMAMAGQEIRDRFESTADYQNDGSALSRFDSWSAAWKIAVDHPLLGTGIRNANTYSQNYGADRAGRTIHNQYLQIAADSGLPAAGVYISMIAVGAYGLGRARRRCLNAEHQLRDGPKPDSAHTREELVNRARDAGGMCLSLQTALLMFSFSSIFLSVELVELPWLLMVLSGILPAAVDRHLRRLGMDEDEEEDEEDNVFTPDPPKKFEPPATQRPERFAA